MFELLLRGLAIRLEIVASYALYTTGWPALRLLTLGRYPVLSLCVDDPI